MQTVDDVLASRAGDAPSDVVARERHGARRSLTIGEHVARTDLVAARARAGGIPVSEHIEGRVIDPDWGVPRADGEEGELSFRGPPVLARYLGDPDATAAAIDRDGWFRYGDLERRPAVELAQVVGVDRPGAGQVAVAFVRLSSAVPEEDLRAHCAAGIAAFKVPERIVAIDDFPTVDGPNGVKIRTRDLRERPAGILAASRAEMAP